jgi:CheY-like chemotaxis protein
MPSSLVVLSGPPLPGRWSLARALERRCGGRRFTADSGYVPLIEITRALAEIHRGCVLVDGDFATVEERNEVLELHSSGQRLLVEWRCERKEAEREVFHRYASRPSVLARAEFGRYLADLERREPVVNASEDCGVVRVGPELPLDEQVEAVMRALACELSPPPATAEEGTRRVMVVEDDPDERATLADVLEELGFEVELAPDAGVALALLGNGAEVELLISDHHMPGMSGVELTRHIGQHHPEVRTVLLTAFGDEDTCRQAVQAHAVTVLAKPLRVIDLERVLDETL